MWISPNDRKALKVFIGIIIALAVVFFFWKAQPMSVGDIETNKWTATLKEGVNIYWIGDLKFEVSPPTFICSDLGRNQYLFANSDKECWRITLNDNTYLNEDSLVVNPYLSVKMEILNAVHYSSKQQLYPEGTRNDWKVRLTFELLNRNFFTAKIQDVTTIFFGREHNVSINTENNLANGLSGGFIVYKVDDFVHDETFFEYAKTFSKGNRTELIPLDTGKIGKTTLEITPYFNIDSDSGMFRLYSSKASKVYDIVSYQPNTSQVLPSMEPEPIVLTTPPMEDSSGLAPAYIYLGLIILGGIVVWLWRKNG